MRPAPKTTVFSTVFLILGLIASPVAAQSNKDRYATSKRPYWQVGQLDRRLSAACQRGEFRQKQYLRMRIGFTGKKGQGVTGIANTEFNLIDPKGLAEKGYTYHFYNQGWSNCAVYKARPRNRR